MVSSIDKLLNTNLIIINYYFKVKKSSKNKAKRTTSNIFGMFSQNQLQEFKQTFQFIDFDKDGFINKKDIVAAFDSLGKFIFIIFTNKKSISLSFFLLKKY